MAKDGTRNMIKGDSCEPVLTTSQDPVCQFTDTKPRSAAAWVIGQSPPCAHIRVLTAARESTGYALLLVSVARSKLMVDQDPMLCTAVTSQQPRKEELDELVSSLISAAVLPPIE